MLSTGVPMAGDSPVSGETEPLPRVEVGNIESPVLRQSGRKMALQSLTSHGRLAKSKLKSPLLRVVEMRKSGLRGRALRQVNKKGSDGAVARASKGKKGFGGRGSWELEPIPEASEEEDGCPEGSRRDGCVEKPSVEESLEEQGGGSSILTLKETSPKQVWQKEFYPTSGLNDCALDLVAAQPLQEMDFVVEQVMPTGAAGALGSEA